MGGCEKQISIFPSDREDRVICVTKWAVCITQTKVSNGNTIREWLVLINVYQYVLWSWVHNEIVWCKNRRNTNEAGVTYRYACGHKTLDPFPFHLTSNLFTAVNCTKSKFLTTKNFPLSSQVSPIWLFHCGVSTQNFQTGESVPTYS